MEITNLFNTTRSQRFLVSGSDANVVYSASAVSLTTLDDFINDKVNLANLQLGVVVDEATDTSLEKSFLVDGDTYPGIRKVRLVQGTPKSGNVSSVNPYNFGDPAYVQSHPIDLSQEIHVVSYGAKQSYSSAWVVGDIAAAPGAINPVDNVTYKFKVAFNGRHQDKKYSNAAASRMFVNIKKLPTAATNVTDRFLKRLCAKMNLLSSHEGRRRGGKLTIGNKPALCLAVNIGGGAGTSITTILGAAVGTQYTYETANGVDFKFTVTADLQETLNQVVANVGNIVAGSTIEVIDLTTAGAVAMGAGAAAADAILVLALDNERAVVDDRMETYKNTILQIGLEGFSSQVRRVVASRTYRGWGYGWQLYKMYLDRAQQEINGSETLPLENRLQNPIPFYFSKDNTQYNVHEIWAQDFQRAGNTHFDRRFQSVILVPVADSTTAGDLNDGLLTLLNSAPKVSFYTEATAPDVFVG